MTTKKLIPLPGSGPVHPDDRFLYERSYRTPFELMEACASSWSNRTYVPTDVDDEAELRRRYLSPWLAAARLLGLPPSPSPSPRRSGPTTGSVSDDDDRGCCWARTASDDGEADLPLHDACRLDGMSQTWLDAGLAAAANVSGCGCGCCAGPPSPPQLPHHRGVPLEFFRELIAAYPDGVRRMNRHGRLPLHVAAAHGARTETLRFLLSCYPQMARARDGDGRTALHLACVHVRRTTTRRCRRDGGSASAAERRARDNVLLLLDACRSAAGWADDVNGSLPAHLAARSDLDPDAMAILLDAHPGAIFAADDEGNAPRDLARGDLRGFLMFAEDEVFHEGKMLENRRRRRGRGEGAEEEAEGEAEGGGEEETGDGGRGGEDGEAAPCRGNVIPPDDTDSDSDDDGGSRSDKVIWRKAVAALATAANADSKQEPSERRRRRSDSDAFAALSSEAEEGNAETDVAEAPLRTASPCPDIDQVYVDEVVASQGGTSSEADPAEESKKKRDETTITNEPDGDPKKKRPRRGGIHEHGAAAPCACDACAAAAAFKSGMPDEDEDDERAGEGTSFEEEDAEMIINCCVDVSLSSDDGGDDEEGMDLHLQESLLQLPETPETVGPYDECPTEEDPPPRRDYADPQGLTSSCACARCAAAAPTAARENTKGETTSIHEKREHSSFFETVLDRLGLPGAPSPPGDGEGGPTPSSAPPSSLRADTVVDGPRKKRRRMAAAEGSFEGSLTSLRAPAASAHPAPSAAAAAAAESQGGAVGPQKYGGDALLPGSPLLDTSFDGKIRRAERMWNPVTPPSRGGQPLHGQTYVRRIEALERTIFGRPLNEGRGSLDERVTTVLTAGPISLLEAIDRAEKRWGATAASAPLLTCVERIDRLERLVFGLVKSEGSWAERVQALF